MSARHSVILIEDKCIGCTDCLKRCPTEAIRVRNGKAFIRNELCIDCGTCIRVCQNHAKKAKTELLDEIQQFKYKVALPAPTIYGQFRRSQDINTILTAIKKLGFDDVFEVARAAELVTKKTMEIIKRDNIKKPFISSACPAIVRLITTRFPSLIDNILPVISPMEAAARAAKKYLTEEKGIPLEDIGVFFISPCGAKATDICEPIGFDNSAVDGAISINDIYMRLRGIIKTIDVPEPLAQTSDQGIEWASIGGEGKGLAIENVISVDGVDNVIQVLDELENGQLVDVDFIEGLACIGGCLGGPLAIKNSFVAKNILIKSQKNTTAYTKEQTRQISYPSEDIQFSFTKDITPTSGITVDNDMSTALEKLEKIQEIFDKLPHIDCGSCGAPTCRALAEDIVRDSANTEDCIFMLREKIHEIAENMVGLAQKLPPPLLTIKQNDKQ